MRDVVTENNVIEVQDGMSGDTHEIFYRQPTNKERAAYQAALFKRKGKKVIDCSFETRLRFGRRICTGFTKGTFGAAGKPFASEIGDADYHKDWKKLISDGAPEVFTAMAFQVFEGTGRSSGEMEFEAVELDDLDEDGQEAEQEAKEDNVPLADG